MVDPAAGTREPAFDHSRLAAASGQETDPEALPFSAMEPAGDAVEFDAFGEHWRCDLDGYTCERAQSTPPGSPLEVPSPDGKFAVFRQGHDLWARSLSDGRTWAPTTDGEPDRAYGTGPVCTANATLSARSASRIPAGPGHRRGHHGAQRDRAHPRGAQPVGVRAADRAGSGRRGALVLAARRLGPPVPLRPAHRSPARAGHLRAVDGPPDPARRRGRADGVLHRLRTGRRGPVPAHGVQRRPGRLGLHPDHAGHPGPHRHRAPRPEPLHRPRGPPGRQTPARPRRNGRPGPPGPHPPARRAPHRRRQGLRTAHRPGRRPHLHRLPVLRAQARLGLPGPRTPAHPAHRPEPIPLGPELLAELFA